MTTNWGYEKQEIRLFERLGNSCIMKQFATVICWNTKQWSNFIPLRSNIQCPIYEFELARRGGLSNMYSSMHAIEIDRTFYRRDIATTPHLTTLSWIPPNHSSIISQLAYTSQFTLSSSSSLPFSYFISFGVWN